MKAHDFIYDDVTLSSVGYMLCRFNGGGVDTVSMPEITFNTVTTSNGLHHHLTSAERSESLTFTMQICKDICNNNNNMEISVDELRDLTRWLNRKSFHKFKLVDDEYSGIYFMASFNLARIEMDGRLVGIELTAVTNSPFAFAEKEIIKLDIEAGKEFDIYNKSDESGHVYPKMTITMKNGGDDFKIENITEGRTMKIKKCYAGETITIERPFISSDRENRQTKIQNDFDWNFFRLVSTFKNKRNVFKATLPCSIEFEYSPIVKIGI